jgi:hypothetical protein
MPIPFTQHDKINIRLLCFNSVKRHIKHVMGTTAPSYEELNKGII